MRVNVDNIPSELKASHRWLVWKFGDPRPSDGKRTKIPYDYATGRPDKPATCARFNLKDLDFESYDGVGFLSIGDIIGVDFDNCVLEDRIINSEVREILSRLKTYTEISPSGKGIRCWLFGKAPKAPADDVKNPLGTNLLTVKRDQIEIYPYSPSSNYLTVTGDRCDQFPPNVRRFSDEEVDWLYSLFRPTASGGAATEPDSSRIFAPMSESKRNEVANGDHLKHYPGASEAVKALVGTIAIECGGDPELTESVFKQTKLYTDTHWREKWTRLGKDELKFAVKNARLYLKKMVAKNRGTLHEEVERSLNILKGCDVEREHLRYLWEPYLPVGKLVHFGGNSSQGKSPVSIDIIARLTSSQPWPDTSYNPNKKSCILLNIEDDISDTIMPRFDLAGGDSSKLFYIKGTKLKSKDRESLGGVQLDKDTELITELAKSIPDLGLIVIDPITNYLGAAKMNAEEEVRGILTPLAMLAAELRITVLTIGHFNRRDKGTDPLQRMMGAAAFSGVARAVYAFGPDPEELSPHAHVIAPARGSLTDKALKYHTDIEEVSWKGETSKVIKVVWDGFSEATAEDAVDPDSRQTKTEVEAAGEILRDFLKDGKRTKDECKNYMRDNGYDLDSLNSGRVQKAAGIKSEKAKGQGRSAPYYWFIPASGDVQEPMFQPAPTAVEEPEY